MKQLSILFALALNVLLANADPIGRDEARQKAAEFLAQRGHSIEISGKSAFKAPRQGSSEDAYLYIFNAENNGGFVVISGDTNTDLILGYADSGSIDEENMPEHIRGFLNDLATEVRIAGEKNIVRKSPRRNVEEAKHYVAPLMTTLWNQGDPYNMLCPEWYDKDDVVGGRSATGCVATAIAQVIAYYKYPEAIVKTIPSHTCSPGEGSVEVTLPSIRKGTKIDWENMRDRYNSESTDAERNAVAKLMLMCGQALKMGYGPSSGAVTSYCVGMVKDYFGFDDSARWAERIRYSADDWTNLIYNEIATGHPVLYRGHSTGGGHAFVLDGFDGDQLFHVNWGWGGGSNGWFKIAILCPGDNSGIGASATADGYSMSQGACVGMKLPDDIEAADDAQLTVREMFIEDDHIRTKLTNFTGTAGDFNASLCIINEDGSLKPIGEVKNLTLNPNVYNYVNFSIPLIANGTYKIVPASKHANATTYFTTVEKWREYFILDVTGRGEYTLTYYKNPVDIEITNWSILSNLIVNQEQKIQATFHNKANEFYDEVHFFASLDEENKGEQICRSMLVLKPDDTENLLFYFKPTETGTYHLWITHDSEGNEVIDHKVIEVTETPTYTENIKLTSLKYNNTSSGAVYGGFLSGKLSLHNNGAEDVDTELQLTLWISWNNNGSYNVAKRKNYPVSIKAGGSSDIAFYFDDCNVTYLHNMTVSYTKQDGVIEGGGLYTSNRIYIQKGIVSYKNDGTKYGNKPAATIRIQKDAVAVDMRDQSVVTKGSASEDPQCLYFVDTDYELPEFLEGCNVVKDGQCGDVTLTPEWGFVAPDAFTPTSISYSVTIPEEYATGWQPLTLPFVPTEITIDGKAVTWKKSDTDYEGAFWLKRFSGLDDEGQVCFDYVDEFNPTIPYIIAGTTALAGKTIEFKATETEVEATEGKSVVAGTSSYTYYGTIMPTATTASTYVMNAEGNAFVPAEDDTMVGPFKAYLNCKLPESQRPASIPLADAVMGVKEINNTPSIMHNDTYSISGVKMNSHNLPKGIYIIGGKKVVK